MGCVFESCIVCASFLHSLCCCFSRTLVMPSQATRVFFCLYIVWLTSFSIILNLIHMLYSLPEHKKASGKPTSGKRNGGSLASYVWALSPWAFPLSRSGLVVLCVVDGLGVVPEPVFFYISIDLYKTKCILASVFLLCLWEDILLHRHMSLNPHGFTFVPEWFTTQ